MKIHGEGYYTNSAVFEDKPEMENDIAKLVDKDSVSLKNCKELNVKYFAGGVENVTGATVDLSDKKAFSEFVSKVDNPEIARMFDSCYEGINRKAEKDRGVEPTVDFAKDKSRERSNEGRVD